MPATSVAAPAVPVASSLARRVRIVAVLAPALVVGLLVALLHPLLGLLALVAVAVGAHLALRRAAPGWVAARLADARPATPATAGEARVLNLVESLSLAIGLPPPEVLVVEAAAPNLLVTGADRTARLVVTTGALEQLDRLQLEAVLAHQLFLVRSGATPVRDLLAATLGRIGAAGAARARTAVRSGEAQADLAALDVTRYPPALLSALQLVAAAAAEPPGPPALAPLWLADPAARAELDLRIATLEELV